MKATAAQATEDMDTWGILPLLRSVMNLLSLRFSDDMSIASSQG